MKVCKYFMLALVKWDETKPVKPNGIFVMRQTFNSFEERAGNMLDNLLIPRRWIKILSAGN